MKVPDWLIVPTDFDTRIEDCGSDCKEAYQSGDTPNDNSANFTLRQRMACAGCVRVVDISAAIGVAIAANIDTTTDAVLTCHEVSDREKDIESGHPTYYTSH